MIMILDAKAWIRVAPEVTDACYPLDDRKRKHEKSPVFIWQFHPVIDTKLGHHLNASKL